MFRLYRLDDLVRSGVVTSRREIPGSDAARFVEERLGETSSSRFAAAIRIEAPFSEVDAYLGHYTSGLRAAGPRHTLWTISDDRLEVVAGALMWLVWPFEIVAGEELRRFMRQFAARINTE